MQHMPQAVEAIALVAPPGISRCHWLLSNEREHEVDFDIDSDCDFLRYNNWHKCQERILPIALSQLCHEYAAVAAAAAATAAAPDDVCDVRGQSMGGSPSNVGDKDNDDVAWAHTMKLINEIQ